MVTHICNLSICRQRQENGEFESTLYQVVFQASLGYIVRPPPTKTFFLKKPGAVPPSLDPSLGRPRWRIGVTSRSALAIGSVRSCLKTPKKTDN